MVVLDYCMYKFVGNIQFTTMLLAAHVHSAPQVPLTRKQEFLAIVMVHRTEQLPSGAALW